MLRKVNETVERLSDWVDVVDGSEVEVSVYTKAIVDVATGVENVGMAEVCINDDEHYVYTACIDDPIDVISRIEWDVKEYRRRRINS